MYFFRCHEVSGMVKYCWLRPLSAKMIDKYQFGSNRICVLLIQKSTPKSNPTCLPKSAPGHEMIWGFTNFLSNEICPEFWASTKLPRTWILYVFFWHHDLGKSQIFWANKRCLLFFYVPKTFGGTSKLSFWYQFTRTGIHIQKDWWFLSFAYFRKSSWSWTWNVPNPSQFGLMIPICDSYITEKSLAFFAASFLALSSAFGTKKPR